MVTVPSYQRTVADRPIFQQGVTSTATAADFGADIGRGLQDIGQGLGQASKALGHVTDLEDTAKAKEADNALAEWSRNAMYGDGGYLTLEGKSAVDARSAFEQSWEAKRKEFGAGLSPGAAKYYSNASNARKNQVLESSIVHAANERKAWVKAASASRVDTFGEDALAGYRDPKKVDFNIAAGQAELRQQAELEGWDADTLANKEAEYVSGVRKNIVMRMAIDDPIAAKTYADRFQGELTGVHQAELASALDAGVKDEQSKSEAARIMGVAPPADNSPAGRDEANAKPALDVEAELAKIKNDDVRDLTRQRINAATTVNNAAREAQAKQNKQDAFVVVEKGGSPDDLSLEQKAAIGVEGMASLWTYYEKKASGDHNVSDPETVYTFTQWAAKDPAAFAHYDLNDIRDQLNPADFKILMDKQATAISDATKAKADGAPLTAAYSAANDALEAVGIATTGLSGDARTKAAKKIALFQNSLNTSIEEFKKNNERNPDQGEVQKMINSLLLPVVMKGPKDFFGDGAKTDARLFEIGTRADNQTVDVNVTYQDVPIDFRNRIRERLTKAWKRPTEDEITAEYEAFLLG